MQRSNSCISSFCLGSSACILMYTTQVHVVIPLSLPRPDEWRRDESPDALVTRGTKQRKAASLASRHVTTPCITRIRHAVLRPSPRFRGNGLRLRQLLLVHTQKSSSAHSIQLVTCVQGMIHSSLRTWR